jgi:hypothetical protein
MLVQDGGDVVQLLSSVVLPCRGSDATTYPCHQVVTEHGMRVGAVHARSSYEAAHVVCHNWDSSSFFSW